MRTGPRVLATAIVLAAATLQPSLAQPQNAVSLESSGQASGSQRMRALLTELANPADESATPPADLTTAFANIEQLESQQPLALQQLFARNPGWERLPGILESNRNADLELEQVRSRYGVAGPEPEAGSPASLERFRADFLFFLYQLGQIDSLVNPLAAGRSAQLSATIEAMDYQRLKLFREAYVIRMMELAQSRPNLMMSNRDKEAELTTRASFSCPSFGCSFNIKIPNECVDLGLGKVCVDDIFGSSTISLDICDEINIDDLLTSVCQTTQGFVAEVNALTGQITNFVNTTSSQITGAFNDIVNFTTSIPGRITDLANSIYDTISQTLLDLVALAPDGFDAFITLLADAGIDITSAGWWNSLPAGAIDAICPDAGTEIPLLGTIGTPAAEFRCRGANSIGGKVFDMLPGTVASLTVKLAGATVYFPVQYLCECAAKRAQEIYFNDSYAFQELLAAKVDVNLQSRATEADLDQLRGLLQAGGATIVVTANKLDDVKLNADFLEGALADQRSFIAAMDQQLRELDFVGRLVDSDSDPALLALPASQGGDLEAVRDTVIAIIQALQAAGEPINQANSFLSKGDQDYDRARFDKAFENYKKAYLEATK